MREQSEEEVRGQVLLPVARQRMLLRVALEDVLEVRGLEQGEHREVLEAVAAVRGRVDERRPVGRPHQVPRPQVAVHARGRLGALAADAVEGAVGDHVDGLVDGVVPVGPEGAGDLVGQGAQALLGPVPRELLLRLRRDGEGVLERAEEGGIGR